MLVDIHTHSPESKTKNQLRFIVGKHSLGIHPWDLRAPFEITDYRKNFEEIRLLATPQMLAVGECGLDRRHVGIAPIELQEQVFKWHFDWASERQLPLIIHCVHAYSDLQKMLKQTHFKGKILLHDYAGNMEESKKFLLNNDCFFSFGKSLFREKSHAAAIFRALPLEKVFLETDGQCEYQLDEIYQKAQALLGIELPEIEKQMESNLISFFSDLHNISAADLIDNLRS